VTGPAAARQVRRRMTSSRDAPFSFSPDLRLSLGAPDALNASSPACSARATRPPVQLSTFPTSGSGRGSSSGDGREGVRGSRAVRARGPGGHPCPVLEQAPVRLRAPARRAVRGGLCPIPVAGSTSAAPRRLRAVRAGGLRLRLRPPRAPARAAGPVRLPRRGGTAPSHGVWRLGGPARSAAPARGSVGAKGHAGRWCCGLKAEAPDFYCTVFVPSSRGWDGIIRPAPAGRHPSPSRPAGRTRPSGPGPLYTVRRDHGGHGGHGALDVTGDARPTVTSALLRAARGRAALAGPDGVDCAAAADLFVTVIPPVPREDVRGQSRSGQGPVGT
jgi:hypothetical protein